MDWIRWFIAGWFMWAVITLAKDALSPPSTKE